MDILVSFLVKGGFSPDKFFWSKKCFCFSNFVSTQPHPLGFLSLFWHQKWDNYCDEDCSHFGRYLFGCLFVQNSLRIFLLEWLNTIDKTYFVYNHFFIVQETENTGHAHFSKNCFDFKKASSKSDQHHVPVQRSRAIISLWVVT